MKITNAVFYDRQMGVTAEPVWQYDYGDELRICGLKLPAAVEIHFALTEKGGESAARVGVTKDNTTIVTIPDTMLENGDTSVDYNVYAWIYLADSAESGHTEYKIRIPVCARAKPAPHDTPEEAELFKKAIAAVNESASRAEAAGAAARSWATGDTGTREGEDTDNAQYYARQAAESAKTSSEKEQAVSSAETAISKLHEAVVKLSSETSKNAENAAQSATGAGNSAAAASTSEQAAIEAAGRSERSESAAAESEKTATAAATAAEKSASNASSAQQRSETAQAAAEKSASAAAASESNASTLETAAAQSAKAAAESEKAAGASAAAASASEQAATAAAQQTSEDRQATETASAAAQQSATAAVEAQQTIQASAEQIETNKTGIESLKEDLASEITRATSAEDKKADKTALALTDRRLSALWKLSEGISYQFETDAAVAYQKDVPSGAKMANVKSIGGKTVVWNQLLNVSFSSKTENGCTIVYENNRIKINGTPTYNSYFSVGEITLIKNHLYYINVDGKYTNEISESQIYVDNANWYALQKTFKKCNESVNAKVQIAVYSKNASVDYDITIAFFDLTQMFGTGNEPSTVEEFEAMFPDDWYPYNEGELVSAPVNEVVERGKNLWSGNYSQFDDKGGLYTTYNYFELPTNGTYTLSITAKKDVEGSLGTYLGFSKLGGKADENTVAWIFAGYSKMNKGETKKISNKTSNGNYRYVSLFKKNEEAFNFFNENFDIQLECGSLATEYIQYRNNVHSIPQAILDLPGYGWAACEVCNAVDFENKKYIQRVGSVDLGSLNWTYKSTYFSTTIADIKQQKNVTSPANLINSKYETCIWSNVGINKLDKVMGVSYNSNNFAIEDHSFTDLDSFKKAISGVMLYYELAEEKVIDLSDILTDDLTAASVEAGGTLTFKNSNGDGFQIPVPNEVEYAVKLSEVASND